LSSKERTKGTNINRRS